MGRGVIPRGAGLSEEGRGVGRGGLPRGAGLSEEGRGVGRGGLPRGARVSLESWSICTKTSKGTLKTAPPDCPGRQLQTAQEARACVAGWRPLYPGKQI